MAQRRYLWELRPERDRTQGDGEVGGARKVEVKGTLALVNRAGHIVSLAGVPNLYCILKHRRRDFLEIEIRFYATNAAVKGLIMWLIFVDSAATLDCTRSVVLSLNPLNAHSRLGLQLTHVHVLHTSTFLYDGRSAHFALGIIDRHHTVEATMVCA